MPLRPSRIGGWIALGALLLVGAAGARLVNHRYERHDLIKRAEALTGGRVERGRKAFAVYGCGGCHSIQGWGEARGLVGPPLDSIGKRAIIAGRLANRPENLQRWIRNPQAVSPGTAMPNLNVTAEDARDIAAFLYAQN